ncbi:TetR family transcriptional regulator [Streptomyces sp. NPDC086010]|uniref:TetR family transcriptional regulator n=1 Tax=Streptomyces sp. NPDC086010 TaxID=3365745 RepID=UPI0037D2EC31
MGAKKPTQRRDAARSRQLLIEAAAELLAERGFERTTVRDIGERAGLDQALIARYFGGKAQLYIAVLRAEEGGMTAPDLLSPDRIADLIDRIGQRGPGPVFQAAIQRSTDSDVQRTARDGLYARVVAPVRQAFMDKGLEQPQLRAEVSVAAVIGVLLARDAGTLEELAGADPQALLPLIQGLLRQ